MALRPQKLLRLIRAGKVGGSGIFIYILAIYMLQKHRLLNRSEMGYQEMTAHVSRTFSFLITASTLNSKALHVCELEIPERTQFATSRR